MLARLILTVLLLLAAGAIRAQPTVVVSIHPYGDLVEQLAGDSVEVVVVLPPGASPHTFEPSPRLVARLAAADLLVVNGALDEWLLDVVVATNARVPVVEALAVLDRRLDELAAGEQPTDGGKERDDSGDGDDGAESGLPERSDEARQAVDGHDHSGVNPHVWLDPTLMIEVLAAVADELAEIDPPNAERYRERAAELAAELSALDEELRDTLAPVAGAPFIPFHDAWPYFARRYRLDLILEVEPFPGREPSPRYLAEAVAAIGESGAPAIFNEVGLGDRPARVLADEAGVLLYRLDPLGRPDESYQDLLRRNARTIAEALLPWTAR